MLEKLQLTQLTQLLSPTNSLRNLTHISVLLTDVVKRTHMLYFLSKFNLLIPIDDTGREARIGRWF